MARDVIDSFPRLEEILSKDEFVQLRYLSCALVEAHVSNDYGIVAATTSRVLRSWGHETTIVPALKRWRTVGSAEEAQNFFNPKYTDSDQGPVQAQIALVCILPCKIVDDENPQYRPIPFAAVTDLFMTPELDVPIYCMQMRNMLSPLAMVPEIKVAQYILLNNEEDAAAKAVLSRMGGRDRQRFNELKTMFSDSNGARYMENQKRETRDKVDAIVARFAKPFSQATTPTQEFFRFYYAAMEKVKAMGDFDQATNTIKIKRRVE